MNRKPNPTARRVALVLLLAAGAAGAVPNDYLETFTATTYRDNATNLARWDTAAGQLKLPPHVPAVTYGYVTADGARDVAVVGELAFLALGSAGLRILNINDRSAPFVVGSYDTPGYAQAVAVAGEYAYVADDASGLLVINIANPSTPTLAGSYNTSGAAMGVAVSGNFALVADFVGLQSFNITNPASPQLTSTSYPASGNVYDVAIAGDQAYVATGTGGLYVFSVLNPALPVFLALRDTPGTAMRVAVQGDQAFVGDGAAGLRIFGIVNPASPTLLAVLDTPDYVTGVAVDGDWVYLADATSGLLIVDAANPSAPVLLGTVDTPGAALDVAVVGELAYVADNTGGMRIVRIAKPAPALGSLGSLTGLGSLQKVAVSGDLAAVVSQGNSLYLVDIANPALPAVIGSNVIPGIPQDVAITGDLAVVSLGDAGIWLFNIASAAGPALVGTYDTPGTARGLAVSGDQVYVADGSVLRVIDISNPGLPAQIGSLNMMQTSNDVIVDGDIAYTCGANGWLESVNVANPAAPVRINWAVTSAEGYSLAIAGDLVAIASINSVKLVDVSNPAACTLVGGYGGGNYRDVAMAGNLVYTVRTVVNTLICLDVQNPASPTLVGSLSLPAGAEGVALSGDHAFVAGGSAGLRVAQVLERRLDPSFDRGRSLSIDASSATVRRARLTATQTSGVSWELSGDGGGAFQPFTPGAAWATLAAPGSDLRWRSTHAWSAVLPNPTVDDVRIEWLYDPPLIDAVKDIGNDQGRQVRVEWTRSSHDFLGDPTQAVEYAVYRKISPLAKAAGAPGADAAPLSPEPSPALRENAELMKAAGWDFVARVPVLLEDAYAVVAPTLADSTLADGQHWTTYRVIALTATPGVFFESPPDSGYSLDNLAPGVPANLAVQFDAGSGHALTWDESPATDFRHFRVYRGAAPGFVPSPATLVQTTAANLWTDASAPAGPAYYKVTALDFAGNESGPAAVSSVAAIDGATPPMRFALAGNAPNPFNPSTRVFYDVPPGGGDLTLRVYDLRGQLVRTLVEGPQPAGRHAAAWDGRDQAGRPLPSGIYVARLQAGPVVESRSMVLAK